MKTELLGVYLTQNCKKIDQSSVAVYLCVLFSYLLVFLEFVIRFIFSVVMFYFSTFWCSCFCVLACVFTLISLVSLIPDSDLSV